MMFRRIALAVLLFESALAFTVAPSTLQSPRGGDVSSSSSLFGAKEDLVATARKLKEQNGVFLLDKAAKKELEEAVCELEMESSSSDMSDFLGDWKLLCTSSSNLERPDFIPENPIREALTKASNKYVTVVQRIRSMNDDGVVDRVDNVIEYESPKQLGNLIEDLPEQLANLDLFNPLEVSETKVVLAHDAKVLDTYGEKSLFTTQISLSSIVLNVAGKSTVLDPKGKDVFGVNVPFADELGQSGTFETTYLDGDVRISRGRVANKIDQLRVFVRIGARPSKKEEKVEEETSEDVKDVEVEASSEEEEEEEDTDSTDEKDEEDPGVGGSDDYDLTPSA